MKDGNHSDRLVKSSRKEHTCVKCNQKIPVGTTCRNITAREGEEYYSGYMCTDCWETTHYICLGTYVKEKFV